MNTLISAGILLISTVAAAQDVPRAELITRVDSADAVESIEDIALTYFQEINYFDQNYPSPTVQIAPEDMLRDRDGLTRSEAQEVIAIARRLRAPDAAEKMRAAFRASSQKHCAELREARTPEETVVVLESHEALTEANNRVSGANLLGEFKPSTRAHVVRALADYRKGVSVVSIEWRKATNEQLEAQKNLVCAQWN